MQFIKERLLEAKAIVLYNDEIIYIEPKTSDDVYGISASQKEWFLKENYWDYYESEVMMSYLRHITADEALQIIESWNREEEASEYPDATDGDIYLNPFFGDLWLVEGKTFVKINDGYTIDLDDPSGFIKVGHVDNVIRRCKLNEGENNEQLQQ